MSEKLTIDFASCDGCGRCIDSCPTDVLRADPTGHKVTIAYPNDCQACFLCQDDCPQHCIVVSYSSANSRQRSIYDQLEIVA
jgi:NAD-dependent dihydropyrimidine dehydrogenase PreA subunit